MGQRSWWDRTGVRLAGYTSGIGAVQRILHPLDIQVSDHTIYERFRKEKWYLAGEKNKGIDPIPPSAWGEALPVPPEVNPTPPVDVTKGAQDGRHIAALRLENGKLREQLAMRADLAQSLGAEFAALPRITLPPAPTASPHRPRSLVLFISDVHAGQLFSRVRGGGLGEYNLEVFAERARRLTAKTLAIAHDLRAGGPVDRLVLAFGGDLLDGHDIHPGHDHEAVGVAAQLRIGPEILAREVVAPLADAFAHVEVVAVPGNHGRLGKKGQLDMVHDSLDLVFVNYMKTLCRDYDNILWHPMETWFAYWQLHGHSFFMAHGDAFKSWLGIPFYGSVRYLTRIQSMLHKQIDAMLVAHHHNAAAFANGFSQIVMNGAWPSMSSFGTWQGLGGAPIQKLLLVSEDYTVATSYDLILATREEMLTLAPLQIGA